MRRLLRADGEPTQLGARAIDVLLVLVRHRERIVSKDQLLDEVWPGLVVEENNLQVQVSALRKVLGAHTIATVPGRGYQFIAELDPDDAPARLAPTGPAQRKGGPAHPRPDSRSRLPEQLPPLYGRDVDLRDACAQLESHALVTVTGPGGIGKTSLALAAAHAVRLTFADGVRVIDLAAVGDPARVATAIAAGLGIDLREKGSAPAVIAGALREQSVLIMLDNCEHAVSEVGLVVEVILQRAPRARLLATSQVPLRLAGEQVLRLEPLALPPIDVTPKVTDAERHGAVQLFVARARAALRGFTLKPDTCATVVEICRRLDGVPLAIELAAARLPLLGLTGLRDRLDQRLQVLTTGARDAPMRQQTLRATLEWSHALLGVDEQEVFRRLGVFVGGFPLELAQRVVVDAQGDPWLILDRLGALVDKSLVVAEGEGVPRYRLLESARAFALEQLAAAGETDVIRRRLAEAMRERLDSFDAAISHEPRFDVLIGEIEPELDNLRAALGWAMTAPGERLTALALLATSNSLWLEADPFGDAIRHYLEARTWLDETVPPALAARFRLAFQSVVRSRMLRPAEWRDEAWRALEAYRTLDDRVGLYKALCALGGATREVIDEARAGVLLEEAEQLEDPNWSPRLRSRRQVALEWWNDLRGRFEASRDAGRQHLALSRAAGAIGEIPALSNLADTEFELGNIEEAISLCREAIARATERGRPAAAAHAYGNIVPALIESGELELAEDAIRAGRSLLVRGLGTAFVLLMPLALLAQRRSTLDLAARLVGCADRAYAAGGHFLHPPERRMRERVLVALQGSFSPEVVESLRVEGEGWSEDDGFARAGIV